MTSKSGPRAGIVNGKKSRGDGRRKKKERRKSRVFIRFLNGMQIFVTARRSASTGRVEQRLRSIPSGMISGRSACRRNARRRKQLVTECGTACSQRSSRRVECYGERSEAERNPRIEAVVLQSSHHISAAVVTSSRASIVALPDCIQSFCDHRYSSQQLSRSGRPNRLPFTRSRQSILSWRRLSSIDFVRP